VTAIVRCEDIVKYPYDDSGRPIRGADSRILDRVSLDLCPGEILALVGENGAGKSTLIKIVGGALPHDGGTLEVFGDSQRFHSTAQARKLGVSVIYQELVLAPNLSVAENLFLGREITTAGLLDQREMNRRAVDALAHLGLDLDPTILVGRLSTAQQQMLEIAKALNTDVRILILDEPTASLAAVEVERLMTLLRQLRDAGLGIIYVSHRLDEVFAIADRITVLKDGRGVGTYLTRDVTRASLIERMVGRKLGEYFVRPATDAGEPVLEVDGLSKAGVLDNVSLSVHAGEIVGLAGLMGSGRTTLARVLFGVERCDRGEVKYLTKPVAGEPRKRIRLGMSLVPEDRKTQGVVLPLSVQRNLAITAWQRLGVGPFVRPARERALARKLIDELRIVTRGPEQTVSTLSGGNQQRVAIGKWLATGGALYILDEPTRGVDVGARAGLYEIMGRIVEDGGAILMISSDLPEILGMSHRIYVMREGAIVGQFRGGQTSEQDILSVMLRPDTHHGTGQAGDTDVIKATP
jgi:ABC-type sugar transport system ATPase subunit